MPDRRAVVARRVRTIPTLAGIFLAAWILSPLLFLLAAIVDIARRMVAPGTPWMATRLVAMLLAYVTAEALGLVALGAVWLATPGLGRARFRGSFAVQRFWAGLLFRSVRRIFGLHLHVEGAGEAEPAPFLLVSRHASIIDNLLPSQLVSSPFGIHVRYVIKEELLSDPAIDVGGVRLGNYFVHRGSGERELGPLREFARDTPVDEAILIFPEGTRFTEEKRRRAVDRLLRRSPRLGALAEHMTDVLPPRPGGTIALLEGRPTDVVVLAHRGLEGFASVTDIWRGAMVGRTIRVRLTRYPIADIPEGRADRAEWLFERWAEIDDWIRSEPEEERA